MLNKIYNSIKKYKINSTRKLRQFTNYERKALLRYLTALVSADIITLEFGIYKVLTTKPDFHNVGKKFEEGILRKLRETNKGGNMAKKEKVLRDSLGREYPAKILDPQIVKRDALVNKVMGKALKLHEKIISEKSKMASLIEKYLSEMANKYGEQWKGNAELISFDGRYKIEVRYRERIEFSEKLQIAKQKIDDCIKRWSKDSNINLQAIIKEAFQVDKKGEIAKTRILGLRRFNINDEKWNEAMDLIGEAIQITSTKQYIAFYERDSEDKPFRLISLNFSAL